MTVGELKQRLKDYPDDFRVFVPGYNNDGFDDAIITLPIEVHDEQWGAYSGWYQEHEPGDKQQSLKGIVIKAYG